jgi:rod shape-determining protein MreC
LIGQVAADPSGRLRVRLSADYERLEFLRVLRHHGIEAIEDPGNIVAPPANSQVPPLRPEATIGASNG